MQDKFDELNDLPISEELLGAYIEGSLRGPEFREIESLLSDDAPLSNFVSAIEEEYSPTQFDTFYEADSITRLSVADYFDQSNYTDLVIPSIDTYNLISELPLNSDINFESQHDFVGEDSHHLDDLSGNDSNFNNSSSHDNGMNDNYDI